MGFLDGTSVPVSGQVVGGVVLGLGNVCTEAPAPEAPGTGTVRGSSENFLYLL